MSSVPVSSPRLSPPIAAASAFLGVGAVNASGWLLLAPLVPFLARGPLAGVLADALPSASAPWAIRAEAAAFELAHFAAAGVLAFLLVAIGVRLLPHLVAALPLLRRGAVPAAVYLPAVALGALLLPLDLTNFSQRQGALPPFVALSAGVLLVSAALPAGVAIGSRLRTRVGRYVAGAGLLAASALNALTLPNDYFVLHLFLTLGAIAVAASAWTGALAAAAAVPKRALPWLLAACALAGVGLTLRPSARAASLLAKSTASVISPWIAASRERLGSRRTLVASGTPSTNPWFADRAQAPAVPPSRPPLFDEPPLVLLITVDALRADVVASGKHDRRLPTLAALRDRAVWFSNARATGTLTKLSISSLMLGTHFSQQYWVDKGRYHTIAEDETRRFPELLRAGGVRTLNFRSIVWLRNGNVLGGFDEDVHVYAKGEKNRYTPAAPVFAKLLPRLKRLDATPTFLFSHLSDPHAPYDLAKSKGSQFARYLAEVALVDEQLGRLVRLLDDTGLAARTLLIVSADHGEAFGEHGSRTHGTTLYDETLRVPLLMVFPGAQPRRVDDLVSLIDLGPTVLDIFGLPTPGTMMGQSLAPYLRGENPELDRPILAETRLMQAWITQDQKKLIVDTRTGRRELYDLRRDPAERDNLADDADAIAGPLADLERFIEVHRLRKDGYEPPFVR